MVSLEKERRKYQQRESCLSDSPTSSYSRTESRFPYRSTTKTGEIPGFQIESFRRPVEIRNLDRWFSLVLGQLGEIDPGCREPGYRQRRRKPSRDRFLVRDLNWVGLSGESHDPVSEVRMLQNVKEEKLKKTFSSAVLLRLQENNNRKKKSKGMKSLTDFSSSFLF